MNEKKTENLNAIMLWHAQFELLQFSMIYENPSKRAPMEGTKPRLQETECLIKSNKVEVKHHMPTIVTKCNADMCNSRELLLCPDITANDCEKRNISIYLHIFKINSTYTLLFSSTCVVCEQKQ